MVHKAPHLAVLAATEALGAVVHVGHRLQSCHTETARLVGLEGLTEVARALEQNQRAMVAGLRAKGVSWGRIGTALGVTKQAANQRFGGSAKVRPRQADFDPLF